VVSNGADGATSMTLGCLYQPSLSLSAEPQVPYATILAVPNRCDALFAAERDVPHDRICSNTSPALTCCYLLLPSNINSPIPPRSTLL
jgi:hypothetical protein